MTFKELRQIYMRRRMYINCDNLISHTHAASEQTGARNYYILYVMGWEAFNLFDVSRATQPPRPSVRLLRKSR